MRTRHIDAILATAILSLVCGCGQVAAPSVSPNVPLAMKVLAKQGPAGATLMAAPSLVDLLGLLHGAGVSPGLDDCTQFSQMPPIRADCWLDVKDPGNSLLVAAVVDEPCAATNSVTAELPAANELTVTAAHTAACLATPGGPKGGAQGIPTLSLLSIPLTALPSDEITVTLVHTGISVSPTKVSVDLRQPLTIHTSAPAVANDVATAITSAEKDTDRRAASPGQIVSLLAVGTSRWSDTSLGCPNPGQTYSPADARGYVVLLRGGDHTAWEYHVSGSLLAFCGQVPY